MLHRASTTTTKMHSNRHYGTAGCFLGSDRVHFPFGRVRAQTPRRAAADLFREHARAYVWVDDDDDLTRTFRYTRTNEHTHSHMLVPECQNTHFNFRSSIYINTGLLKMSCGVQQHVHLFRSSSDRNVFIWLPTNAQTRSSHHHHHQHRLTRSWSRWRSIPCCTPIECNRVYDETTSGQSSSTCVMIYAYICDNI